MSAIAQVGKLLMPALLLLAAVAVAQNDTTQSAPAGTGQPDQQSSAPDQQSSTSDQQSSAPAPAFGQDSSAPLGSAENPPVSSLDQPSLEAPATARSYLVPAVQVSQSVDTNVGNAINRSTINGITRGLGSLTLQKLWSRSDLALSYIGGGAFYTGRGSNFNQVHQFDGQARYLWRTGQASVRDAFSYLPEGSFGYGSYGGASNYVGLAGLGGLGGGLTGGIGGTAFNFFGPGQFASLGRQPRITNTVIGDVTQGLSPRSSVTAAGSYGVVHFTNDLLGFINSRQISGQVGYNYQFGHKDQIAVVYGYQNFRYPNAALSDFTTDVFNALYGHRITGKLDLVLGGGPQITNINNPLFGSIRRITFSGRAQVNYRVSRTHLSLLYDRYNTSGSGLFTGATTDLVRGTASRPINRQWNALFDVGYSRNSRILPSTIGVNAQTYAYWYGGGSVNRQLGRYFSVFISYQYNRLGFDQTFCSSTNNANCSRSSQRHDAAVGLTWHPRPIRLD